MSDYPAFDPKSMPTRFLGNTGLKVPLMTLGGWLTYGGTVKGDPVGDCMQKAFDLGINFFDTAEIYANGESEKEMGRVLKEKGWLRDEIIVSTKVFFGTGRKDPNQKGLSRKHIIEGTRASLRRLQLDYVDILFCHRPDITVGMEEIVRAMNWCIEQGLTFYWGTSEWNAQQLQEAHAVADRLGLIPPQCEQPQYSMLYREKMEKEYLPIFKKGLGTTIWSPLASGLLTGKYNDGIPKGSRFDTNADFFKSTIEKLKTDEGKKQIEQFKALGKVAEKIGCSQSQLALAWCARNENVSTILLGATKPEQIEENVKSAIVSLCFNTGFSPTLDRALEYLDKLTPEILEQIEGILKNKPEAVTTFGR